MRSIFIAVFLSFIGPGLGQLYNKEKKKGAYLLVVSLLVSLAAMIWYGKALLSFMPPDLTTIDPTALQNLVHSAMTQVQQHYGRTLAAYEIILFALVCYSVVDAAQGAARRRVPTSQH